MFKDRFVASCNATCTRVLILELNYIFFMLIIYKVRAQNIIRKLNSPQNKLLNSSFSLYLSRISIAGQMNNYNSF